MIPKELRYLSSHEWARLDEAAGVVTVGLSDFAVEQLGDIVFLELPQVGDSVKKDKPFGAIESVKAASDLYTPISGEVLEVNEPLCDNLELFKDEAYGQAWMIKIKTDSADEYSSLMDATAYEEHCQQKEE
jgi:glycine cleavage system H protein